MKAVRIHDHGDKDVLLWEEVPLPDVKDDQVLVEIKAAAINHLDIWIRKGIPGIPLPMIIGSDGAGIVSEIGKGVNKFNLGDEVIINPLLFCGSCSSCLNQQENQCHSIGILGETTNGTNCEFISLSQRNLIKKPSNISFESAASFSLAGQTSYQMLINRAKIKKDDIVFIWGASSGVGSFGLQIAKAYGCNVIATAGSKKKCEYASKLGADLSLNHYEDDIAPLVKDYTKGKGVNIVFEHSGFETWKTSMKILSRYGRLVTCGSTTGPKVSIDLRYIFFKQQSILGSTMGTLSAFNGIMNLIKDGKVIPVVDKVFTMKNIADAHKYVEDSNQFGKVILVP
ncbi:MAG: zinc-binding dehydrogenase [Candidatus Marinimicrobia bacterium]|nr:zinc-binding dehydrogenase [Candidatus Neomarinimicrobiota bacterium]